MNTLELWGWSPFFEQQLLASENQLVPARVAAAHRDAFVLFAPDPASAAGTGTGSAPVREWRASLSGALRHRAESSAAWPAVGDWVLAEPLPGEPRAVIQRVLERRAKLSRRAPGKSEAEQLVAANVDLVLLATSLNEDLNPKRLERALVQVWESGAEPVVLLTKLDLEPAAAERAAELRARLGAEVLAVCAFDGRGLDALRERLGPGRTGVLLGSSGVGKSTLLNALLGRELLATGAIRDDGKGRHTTTHRQLLPLPPHPHDGRPGGLLIDTPGVRELQLWEARAAVEECFEDLAVLEKSCRFSDCRHAGEPGCAIQAALETGALDPARWESFDKLKREAAWQERRNDAGAAAAERKRWRSVHKQLYARLAHKRRIE